jgi:multiple sugar transport system substrate-binding protein
MSRERSPGSANELVVIWHEGPLGELLADLCRQYTDQTAVRIHVRLVPWAEWHDVIASDFEKGAGEHDLVVFDSQSISEFASQGHLLLLNPLLDRSIGLSIRDYDPSALRIYSEYPEGSGDLYALPLNQDIMGLVFRRDLFQDPDERDAFRKTYGHELAVPHSYRELRDVARFFTRPDADLYGIGLYGSEEYDGITSAFNNVLWSFGGDLWDPNTGRAQGVIDSPASVAALDYFRTLFDVAPPGAVDWYYDEVNDAVQLGRVSMAVTWFYFFRSYVDPETSPFADQLGFALLPGETGEDAVFRRHFSVGGQGIGLSRHSKQREEAWKFLEWFMGPDIQWQWTRGGAQTGRDDIVASPAYLEANAFNRLFRDGMPHVKDYWHLVEYPELLAVYQRYVRAAVTGELPSGPALQEVASRTQSILDRGARR